MAFLAIDIDVSARLLNKAIDHAEAEAGPLAALRGEKRLEDLFANLGRDAAARIAHGNHHITTDRNLMVHFGVAFVDKDVAGLQGEPPAAWHGIARIEREIEKRGHKLIGIDQSRKRIV